MVCEALMRCSKNRQFAMWRIRLQPDSNESTEDIFTLISNLVGARKHHMLLTGSMTMLLRIGSSLRLSHNYNYSFTLIEGLPRVFG